MVVYHPRRESMLVVANDFLLVLLILASMLEMGMLGLEAHQWLRDEWINPFEEVCS